MPDAEPDSLPLPLAHRKIALLTDGYATPFLAKTGTSLLRYRGDDIVAVLDATAAGSTARELLGQGGDIPVVAGLVDIPEADALYVGIAPPGGKLPAEWRPIILEALRRKMDIVSGLHDFLTDNDEYVTLAAETGSRLVDVRRNRYKSVGKGHRFRKGCVRIHSVGHDCSVGKMVATIEIERGLRELGQDAKFLATGQTGIMISGEGFPIDCIVSDFVNGAAEELCRVNESRDFLLVEGQGSISHPAYSGVTLGLLHGCAPDGLVFCFEAGRTKVEGFEGLDIPPLKNQMQALEVMANLRHPCRIVGLAVNTRYLKGADAEAAIARAEAEFGLPACDVYRTGAGKLVQACLDLRKELLAR